MKKQTSQIEPSTFAEVLASLKETNLILTEKFAETDRLSKENELRFKETDRFIKDIRKQIGGMAHSNGEVAETFFINSITKDLKFAGQEFDTYAQKLKKGVKKLNLKAEFDLALFNCTSVALIEIKYKARKEDIDDLLELPSIFKQLFPEYAHFNIYLGLAGLSIENEEKTIKEAKKQGIAIIKQVGENMVVNDENLKVF